MIRYEVCGELGVIRLDAPPLNTISLAMLDELVLHVRRAAEDNKVRRIVLTGGPRHFSAGADLGIFREIRSPADAQRVCEVFQEAFREIEDCPKPVIALLAGRVMGGGLELAMACHYRVADQEATFSLPEVKLGINPGAGGTQRLPRLIGLRDALRLLLTGEPIDARQALDLGLIDAVYHDEDQVEAARNLLAATPRRTSQRQDKIQDGHTAEAALREAESRVAQSRPEIIAPRRILEAVRTGIRESFEAGLSCERVAFADCMGTPGARNRIYLFQATRQTSKIGRLAGVEPARVEKVGVVGMGTMGTGIAQALIASGLSALVLDEDAGALDRGVARIGESLTRRVKDGKLSAEQGQSMVSRLRAAARWEDLAEADLVIEAVFEDAAVKRAVLGRLEDVCASHTVLASNTSTISLDAMAGAMRHPGRLVGMHFFNPAHRMPLVEVIHGGQTCSEAVATTLGLARSLRKTPVLVRNREGFLVSRVFVPYLNEAFRLWQEGAEPAEIDRAMVAFGFPMGPLALIDMSGMDILERTDRVLGGAFPWHGAPPPIISRLTEAGCLGQKSGSGVYRYNPGDHTPHPSDCAQSLVDDVRRQEGITARPIGSEEITRRLVLRMVNEAFYVVEEGTAQQPSDLDVATVLGLGFPDFRGGVLRYAEDEGHARILIQLEELAARWGQRFAPCELLRQKGAQ